MNNDKSAQEELTARQIFKQLIAGQIVKIPPDEALANQLKNHLNVIKSREKKMFASLGLDFVSSVISVKYIEAVRYNPNSVNLDQVQNTRPGQLLPMPKYDPKLIISTNPYYEIKLVAPKQRRKYTVFTIENNNEPATTP